MAYRLASKDDDLEEQQKAMVGALIEEEFYHMIRTFLEKKLWAPAHRLQ